MMNLISFETPPLGRRDSTTTTIKVKEASSSSTCFHSSHLDLSLGISLSRGGSGSGSCDAAGCGGAKAIYGGGDVGCVSSGMITAASTANMLGAGHGRHDIVNSGSWTAAFMPSPTGFMHPWSLAARQQKAAAEQDRSLATSPPATYAPRDARVVPLPAAVGWPPVHTSRRNLVTTMQALKPDAAVKLDGPKVATTAAVVENNAAVPRNSTVAAEDRPANMFAKVHMDGYLIGRKINLRANRSYDSLSRVLTKMTNNFLCPADYSSTNSGEDCANSNDYIFLYEDFEGDRMLIGDVPWELFLASAKRLYIARNPASGDRKGHDEAAKEMQTEEAKNN